MGVVLRSQIVPIFAARARRLGVQVDDLFIRHRLVDSGGEVRISCNALRAFTKTLATRAGDELFGFHAALEMPPGAYGLLEYVVRNTPTLRALVLQLVRFGRLINAQLVVKFDETSGRLEQRIAHEPECLGKQGNEFSLAHQVKIVREACAAPVALERVFLAHASPEAPEPELLRFFGTPDIAYASGFNGVDLSPGALDTPLTSADPTLLGVLEGPARELLAELSGADEVEGVRRAVVRELETGEPTAKHIAQLVGVSERTLHRRVAAHGTTFGALVDQLRHELALAYLEDRARSVHDVALLLGYSDGRAFARAFRRWTKTTPLAWRRR